MKSHAKLVLYGFLIWLVPFVISMAVFAFIPPETALFDTIMSVSLALAATFLSFRYFKQIDGIDMLQGLRTGTIWMVLAVLFDVPFFFFTEQMKMAPGDYFADIGLAYLMIPIIAAGIGRALDRR